MKTRLSQSATPGRNYSSFTGKTEATSSGSANIMMLGVG